MVELRAGGGFSPARASPHVAGWWLERFEAKVSAGERHPRTLEAHRYHLEHHLLPALEPRRMSALTVGALTVGALTVDDIAVLLDALRAKGCSPKTSAGALATLHSTGLRISEMLGLICDDIDVGLGVIR